MAAFAMLFHELGEEVSWLEKRPGVWGRWPVPQYRSSYVRFSALLSQLGASALSEPRSPSLQPGLDGAALRYFLALCGSRAGLSGAPTVPPKPGSPFLSGLAREVERLRCMIATEADALWNRVLDAIEALKTGSVAPAAVADELTGLGAAYVALNAFLRQNAAACVLLAAAFDRQPCPTLAELVAGAEGALSAPMRVYAACLRPNLAPDGLEAILVALSDTWELCRAAAADAAARLGAARWVAPQKFVRTTRKFWLRPRDVAAFKAAVIPHLPVLIYGDRDRFTERDPEALRCFAEHAAVSDAAPIASVYLDEPETLPVYHARLRRSDGASAVRLRWYGERDAHDPSKQIFVEQKIHRESYTGQFSSKERASLRQEEVAAYLAGRPDALTGRSAHDAELLGRVQELIAREGQAPFLRTCYSRTAFQTADSAEVRISMDSDLRMISEVGAPVAPGDWCRDLAQPLAPREVVNFPYIVVEVKLQRKPPEWLVPLLKSGMLIAVPKFSKHIHGTAVLFQAQTETVPHWFLPDPKVSTLMTPACWEEMADKSDALMGDVASWLFPSAEQRAKHADEPPNPALAPKPSLFHRLVRRAKSARIQRGDSRGASADDSPSPEIAARARARARDPPALKRDSRAPSPPSPSAIVGAAGSHLNRSSSSSDQDVHARRSASKSPAADESAKDLEAGKKLLRSMGSLGSLPGDEADDKKAPISRANTLVRTRVEPKTFFANERTFLAWLQISVLVMLTALSLLGGSSVASTVTGGAAGGGEATTSDECHSGRCYASKISGAIIAPVAILFMVYALYMYKKRTIQIMRRETVRYDDQRGPVALVVILILVTLISYIISLVYGF
ncbi:hypothetical protein QBZ16_004555 [Prototheca wickerhamii]|uniref:Vacuolar transporter chaperone 4 n=1 Tax=Prototheca wickerhamii TaxID=3111 RepID=A0AAD9IIH3_PROWI|nr:hypothetical protein QBZ16_004555 [Prototheca wickerhamii]